MVRKVKGLWSGATLHEIIVTMQRESWGKPNGIIIVKRIRMDSHLYWYSPHQATPTAETIEALPDPNPS